MAIATIHKGSFFKVCNGVRGFAPLTVLRRQLDMRNLLTRGILLTLVVLCAGCAAHTPAEKAVLTRAENLSGLNIDFSDREIFTGTPCAVLPEARMIITKVDGALGKEFRLPEKRSVFVPPGEHTLSVVIETGTSVGHSTTHTSGRVTTTTRFSSKGMVPEGTLPFTFEAGKHYRLRHASWGSFEIILEEITDETELAAIARDVAQKQADNKKINEITASYYAFARQNPQWLEGKWAVGENKDELEFSGNTVTYVAPKAMFIDTRNTLKGSFMYDRNTIVIRWNSFTTFINSATREQNPDFYENAAWYYTLDGDTLDIKRGGFIIPVDIGGTYKRVH